jgi:UDP-N-acetylmuramoyl-L-alanyl-D-glutamate--2,6-diaminopimelate ligase
MQLRRLLSAVPGASVRADEDVHISDITYDSRRVAPGSLFVAIPTVGGAPDSGGARFVAEAVSRGAAAVVTAVDLEPAAVPVIRVPDARAALADLAAEFFGHPSRRLQVFAVTGTDGKTTTTYLLDQILSAAGHKTGLIGTVEIKIGERREPNLDRMTTPESLDLQRLLAEMAEAGVTHVSLEASSHALALDRLRGCLLAACAVTNITGDHVEFHGSWDAYLAAKTRLFTDLERTGPAVLNRDDASFAHLAQVVSGPMLTYGVEWAADLSADVLSESEDGTRFEMRANGKRALVQLPLPGRFNVSNALAAAALGLSSGVELEVVAAALCEAKAPPGRLQRVDEGQPFHVLVDYAHTINAFRSVLAELRRQTSGRLIAVFGAAGNRDRAKRPYLAQLALEYTDFFVITNEDPFGEDASAIIAQIASGVPAEEMGSRCERENDRGRAIARAIARAEPGDTVIILGKGHERSIVANGQKEPWNDVEAARKALRAGAESERRAPQSARSERTAEPGAESERTAEQR